MPEPVRQKYPQYSIDDLNIEVGIEYTDGAPSRVYASDDEGRLVYTRDRPYWILGWDRDDERNIAERLHQDGQLEKDFEKLIRLVTVEFPQVKLQQLDRYRASLANAQEQLQNAEGLTRKEERQYKEIVRHHPASIRNLIMELRQVGGRYKQDLGTIIGQGETAPPPEDKRGFRNLTPDKQVKLIKGFRPIYNDPEAEEVGWVRVLPEKTWYHGTRSEFESFDPERGLAKHMGFDYTGLSFAGTEDLAESYAELGPSSGEGGIRYGDEFAPSIGDDKQIVSAKVDLSSVNNIIPIYRVDSGYGLEGEFETLAELQEYTRAAGYPAFMRVFNDDEPFPELVVVDPSKISIISRKRLSPKGEPDFESVIDAVSDYKKEVENDNINYRIPEYHTAASKSGQPARHGRGRLM